jgi:iron(III) transport system substrate-binding protein
MRNALVPLLVVIAAVLALPALAFEIEAEQRFGPAGATNELSVLSTTDISFFAPLAEAFLARQPNLALRYVQAGSQELFRAVDGEGAAFDLVISSAMDLQMKLANDGYARALPADLVAELPVWARWRDRLVSIAQEPVVLLLADAALPDGQAPPRSRRDLIALLRDHPQLFAGRIGTYDPRISGAGYLFLTQDARMSDSIWRLAEVMGRLDARLYCCSGDMIAGLLSGELLVGYNVLGSYAAANLPAGSGVQAIALEDFTVTLQRTALIPVNAPLPEAGAALLRFLLSDEGQLIQSRATGFAVMRPETFATQPWLRPIRLDPGLLSSLDSMTRRRFLAEWTAALDQP